MNTGEFTKLFQYMTRRFDKIEKSLEQKADKADLNRVLDMLDSMIKRQETYDLEKLVIGHQLNRHENWINELADHTNHKLSSA